MRQVVAILLAFIFFLPGPVLADEKIRGKYEVIGDVNKLKEVKTIKMLEFFNYSCGHCYRFLETSKNISELPLYIDETPAITIAAMSNRAVSYTHLTLPTKA